MNQAHMTQCQRAALAAAALSDAQKSDIVVAYSETARELQKLQADVAQLQAQLAQVHADLST